MRFTLDDGITLETARDCHGQPRLIRFDDTHRLPPSVDRTLWSLAKPVSLSPSFYWVDVPLRFRAYHVNEFTLRFVFRQRAASQHAAEALVLLHEAYQTAGRATKPFLSTELQELLYQWDNEPISC